MERQMAPISPVTQFLRAHFRQCCPALDVGRTVVDPEFETVLDPVIELEAVVESVAVTELVAVSVGLIELDGEGSRQYRTTLKS